MFWNNKELRRSILWMLTVGSILTVTGFWMDEKRGWLVLLSCAAMTAIHLSTEYFRYRKLQKLSRELDGLLVRGTPLPIQDYDEGELSILASQIQKITLQLKEAAEQSAGDRKYLADSLADISHQLRTPLTAMNLTVTMLQSEAAPPELVSQLDRLLQRTEWLVETLLKLSKLDAGTVTLAKDTVSVRDLITRSSAPIAVPMDLRDQKLVVQCAQEQFTGDLVWSGEALGNILKNAMDHTPAGGTITVTAEETALFTQITVEDTGPGFDPKDIPHLFERFYRGSNASESSYGIGLALARSVIAAQNGTVQAMNGEKGARFIIKFYKQVI